VFTDN